MDRIDELEARLDELTEMHAQLGARFCALTSVCRAMLPLIDASPAMISRLAVSSYDTTNEQIERQELDEAHQKVVRLALNQLWGSLAAAAQLRHPAARPGSV